MATNSALPPQQWPNWKTSVLCLLLVLCVLCNALVAVHAEIDSTEAPEAPKVVHSDELEHPNESLTKVLDSAVTEVSQSLCDVSSNCTEPHQICMNGRCGCMPNFAWRNGKCHREDCLSNQQLCSEQDPNRECEALALFGYSHCVCREGYIEDPLTLICRPKCVSDMQHMCEGRDSANSLCNVYRCQCKANFRRNSATGLCESFRCDHDSQCWTEGDKYRACVNGTCACSYEEDPITQRCMLKFTSLFKIRYYYSWRTERILLATIFIVPIVFYYCVLQNMRRVKSTVVSFRAPRPGEQFYSHQSAISIQSPKFMTPTGGPVEVINTEVKKTPQTKIDPKGESKGIKYERFS